jgi:hypothetical protein
MGDDRSKPSARGEEPQYRYRDMSNSWLDPQVVEIWPVDGVPPPKPPPPEQREEAL